MIFLGDIHGDFNQIAYICYRDEEKTPKTIIQIGDFGAGFSEEFWFDITYLNQILKEHNTQLYVVRGNHDNPTYFDGNFSLSNITFLADYSVITIEGKNILCVGGAVSIDRNVRKENVSWWVNEIFEWAPEKIKSLSNIDIVVTHTAPSFCYPTKFNQLVYNYSYYDDNLLDDLIKERTLLDLLYNNLIQNNKITHWVYGHFHTNRSELINDVSFHLLSINQTFEL